MRLVSPGGGGGKTLAAVLLAISFGALAGSHFSDSLSRFGRVVPSEELSGEVDRFQAAMSAIEEFSANSDDVEDAVLRGAIPEMLALLDPHSQFFEPAPFVRLREEQTGSYAGIGMEIVMFEGHPIVLHPFPGSPAFAAGIQPGDAIERVDGQTTKGRTLDEVASLVRGIQGTPVHLRLKHEDERRFVEMDVVRDSIPRPTVPLAFMLRPGVGYVQIRSFGETTADEFDEALETLHQDGMEGLVLDLRGNHGGLLSAGVHVAGKFLEPGALIVSHHGRASRERRYVADSDGSDSHYPVSVLVDCRSASAAEIVAGALQDHDRALVAGSTTFGKGLVQTVLQLPQAAGMVLTTARYYTPSGRMIQRRYDDTTPGEYYANPCRQDFEPDRNDARLTDAGRVVYGGSGIEPDVEITPELVGSFERKLTEVRAFERYAHAVLRNRGGELDGDWRLSERGLAIFRGYAERLGVSTADEDFRRAAAFVKRKVRRAVYTEAVHLDEGARADAELDPSVLRAAELLPRAAELRDDPDRAVARIDPQKVR